MPHQRQQFLDFALQLAKTAEAQIMPRFRNCAVNLKSDGTEVTEADREAERAMRALITKTFPGHDVLGEEFGALGLSKAEYQWVLDPVDGTSWFTLGMPTFGTLVALVENQQPVVGVIHFPALGETVYAAQGLGCWWKIGASEPARIRVRANVPLRKAVISASGPHNSDVQFLEGQTPYRLSALIRQAGKFKFCGDCLQHALVCQGRIHAAVDTIMQPWDIAALVPCVEEAGGIATNLSGQRDNVVHGGSLLTSCDEALHQEILKVLRP